MTNSYNAANKNGKRCIKSSRNVFLFISIFLFCQFKTNAQINAGADFYLDGILKKLRTQFNVPSVCGTLVIDGKIVAFGATGVRKQGNAAQVKDDDLFAIGSVTKTITGFLAAKVIEQNQNNTFT